MIIVFSAMYLLLMCGRSESIAFYAQKLDIIIIQYQLLEEQFIIYRSVCYLPICLLSVSTCLSVYLRIASEVEGKIMSSI